MSIQTDIINHPAYIRKLRQAGGEAYAKNLKAQGAEPDVNAGLFEYEPFAFGKVYQQYDLFTYNGQPGFVRQAHTSMETWAPFTPGTESLYGARPRQRPDGTYPYIYNMKATIDMRVQSAKDNAIYMCIQAADPLLYDPAEVPAIFIKEEEA